MNRYVSWIVDRGEELAQICRRAGESFSHDPALSGFLALLTRQEEERNRLLRELLATGNAPPLEALDPLLDAAARNTFATILDMIGQKIQKSGCDRKVMIAYLVSVEFSRWRLLRNCMQTMARSGRRELERIAAGMEKQRATIVAYLGNEPDGESFLPIMKELMPVWEKRILILDDETTVAMVLAEMLKLLGATETFRSGVQALERLKEAHFDAVISDYAMPGMDGIEFFHEAMGVDPSIGRRFLFLTGALDDRLVRVVEEFGISLLQKPVPMTDMESVVAEIVGAV